MGDLRQRKRAFDRMVNDEGLNQDNFELEEQEIPDEVEERVDQMRKISILENSSNGNIFDHLPDHRLVDVSIPEGDRRKRLWAFCIHGRGTDGTANHTVKFYYAFAWLEYQGFFDMEKQLPRDIDGLFIEPSYFKGKEPDVVYEPEMIVIECGNTVSFYGTLRSRIMDLLQVNQDRKPERYEFYRFAYDNTLKKLVIPDSTKEKIEEIRK